MYTDTIHYLLSFTIDVWSMFGGQSVFNDLFCAPHSTILSLGNGLCLTTFVLKVLLLLCPVALCPSQSPSPLRIWKVMTWSLIFNSHVKILIFFCTFPLFFFLEKCIKCNVNHPKANVFQIPFCKEPGLFQPHFIYPGAVCLWSACMCNLALQNIKSFSELFFNPLPLGSWDFLVSNESGNPDCSYHWVKE